MNNDLFIILGASGFIGKHLTQHLVNQGQLVICYSRKIVPNKCSGATYYVISDYTKIDIPKNAIVFHLAETHHIKEVEDKGDLYIQETVHLAEELLKKKPKRFIYASSTAVYEDDSLTPHKPDSNKIKGKTVYARAKLNVEQAVISNGGVVARLTNTFGPGMSELNLFTDILKQINENYMVLREATPVRDYIWIEDLVDGLYRIGLSDADGVYNIASGHSISCENLCHLILKIKNCKQKKIQFTCPPRVSIINIDINETKEKFNWEPKHTLKSGIIKLIEGVYE
jgi:nucleoside-diphosphate-sugar epimerase